MTGIGEEPQKEIGRFAVALALPEPAMWPWASYLTFLGLFPYGSHEQLDCWICKDPSSCHIMVVEFGSSSPTLQHLTR